MNTTETPDLNQVYADSYHCGNCGAYVKYNPGTTELHCEYCGSITPIEVKVVEHIRERDFRSFVNQERNLDRESAKVVLCHHCNAESTFDEEQKSMECPYCGTALIESDVHYERLIKPSYLMPFKISEAEVQQCMTTWISKLSFAPNKLKKRAVFTNHLKGVFIPYWTYDAQTVTSYSGQRGDNYTVTVGSGKNRRTEVRTRWRYVSGVVSRFFDDIMVPASRLIPEKVLNKLENWDRKAYVEYDKRFLAGQITEKYTVTLADGYEQAKSYMDSVIRQDIRRDIGGDHQRISSSNTDYSDIKFKLVLLPLFISTYTYNNKLYHFYVNGRNGQINGDRPYSAWKIFFAVLFGLAALGLIIYWLMQVE